MATTTYTPSMLRGAGTRGVPEIPVGSSTSYLLDDYGTNIGAAYSFRKLSSTYSGNCITLRENGGGTTAEIGFDGDYIDEAAIIAHCGVNSGYIQKWYDQSGAFPLTSYGDLENTNTTYQPRIYDGSVVLKKDGLVYADGCRQGLATANRVGSPPPAEDWLLAGWGFNSQDTATFSVCYQPTAAGPTDYYGNWFGTVKVGATLCGCISKEQGLANTNLDVRPSKETWATPLFTSSMAIPAEQWNLAANIWRNTPGTTYLNFNGVLGGSTTAYTKLNFREIGMAGAANSACEAWSGEWLLYQTPPSAGDIAGIEANIMNYYGIS